jgi:2-polyprenyl-3-methyl-5-hydroxy-6-metoxy-1,4-benzoquinol methylase
MRRIKTNNINTEEYWNSFATEEYTDKDLKRGGSICKFDSILKELEKDNEILDVGCLNGNLYNFLKTNSFCLKSFTGVDLSEKLINLARSRFPEQTWICSSCYSLPFDDDKFDIVTILETLEHLDEPIIAI